MIYTFSKESSYGVKSITQDYVLDIVSENVIENINYEKAQEFNHPTRVRRYPTVQEVEGRVGFELTYGNEAWNILLNTVMGQKIRMSGFALASTPEKWNVLIGQLSADLSATATSFTITEYTTGDFDNVDGIIVDNEYIAITTISNGVVTASTRGSEGSSAVSHNKNALVYGVVTSGSKYIDIISRYRSGFSYFLPTSLTSLILRGSDYFCFPGTQFSDFVFSARPPDGISTSAMMRSKYSEIITLASPSTSVDGNVIVDTDHIGFYSMGNYINLGALYFEISNTMTPGRGGFFDNTKGSMVLNQFSVYGQFSPVKESSSYLVDYRNDVEKNLSMTIHDGGNNIFVFSFNDVKWGTMIHTLKASILISDSIPFYVFGENSFNILIQGTS